MDEEYQRMAANSIAHEAFCAGQAWQQAAAAQERPCVLWKPRLFRDGNQWCALLGENIQDGAVGFGDSPDAAMLAFDEAWREKLPPAPGAQPAPIIPEGWKLVPIKPTPSMKTAGIGVEVYQDSPPAANCLTWEEVEAIYTAMIEVAPEAKP